MTTAQNQSERRRLLTAQQRIRRSCANAAKIWLPAALATVAGLSGPEGGHRKRRAAVEQRHRRREAVLKDMIKQKEALGLVEDLLRQACAEEDAPGPADNEAQLAESREERLSAKEVQEAFEWGRPPTEAERTNGPEDFAFATDRVFAPGRGRKMRFCTNLQIYADDITIRSGRWLDGVYYPDEERSKRAKDAAERETTARVELEEAFRTLGFDPGP